MELKFKLKETPRLEPRRTQQTFKPSSLAFINVGNPTQSKDRATLRKVRRHVMKDIGRSRRSGQTQKPDLAVAKPMDQFVPMPTHWGDVQVCVSFKQLIQAMDKVSEGVVSLAVVDPTLRSWQKISQRADDPPSLREIQKYTESLSLVRRSILPRNQTSQDGIIGTIICLAVFDARVGNLDSWRMHMLGLQRLLSPIGGFHFLQTHASLRLSLLLADVLGSLKQDSVPIFPLLDPYPKPKTLRSPVVTRILASLEEFDPVNRTPITVISDALSLVASLDEVLRRQFTDDATVSDLILPLCTIDHQVLSLQRWDFVTGEGTAPSLWALAELVRTAAISIVAMVVSQTSGDVAYIMGRRESPFQYLMSRIDGSFWVGKLELKLWALVVQLCMSAGFSRLWYLDRIIHTMELMGLRSWDELMTCLRQVVWIEDIAPLEMRQLQLDIEKLSS